MTFKHNIMEHITLYLYSCTEKINLNFWPFWIFLIQIKKMIMFVVNCNVIQLKNSKFSIKISNHHILTLINFKICQSDKQNIKNCIIWMLVLNATAKPSNRSRERMWGPIASETAGEPNQHTQHRPVPSSVQCTLQSVSRA